MGLLATFRDWWGSSPAGADGVAVPLGLGAILATKERAARIARSAAFLPDVEPEVMREIVRTFLEYVVDLPASERHHHRDAFGLFDHSLEVAEFALRAAQTVHFVDSTAAYPEEQEYRLPRLRFATWLFGLLHDAGKIAGIHIHGPKRDLWNWYLEPLALFYARHGRDRCTLTWKFGRGLDPHTWETAYLAGKFMTPAVLAYVGPKIVSEIIQHQSTAANELHRLIEMADAQSTRESLARQAKAEQETRRGVGAAPVFAAATDHIERLPDVLARAIADGTLRVNDVEGAEVYLGARYVLLRYPVALQRLGILLKDAIGPVSAEARALDGSEEAARALANALHRQRKLLYDIDTDGWKMKAKLARGTAFDVTSAVLLHRTYVDPALRTLGDLPGFDGEVVLTRASDGARVPVDDFKAAMPDPKRVPAPVIPPAPAVVAVEPVPSVPAIPRPAQPPAEIPPAAAPVAVTPAAPPLRKFISGEVLLDDIRNAMLNGTIPTNVWNGTAYVLEDVTYMISPKGFLCLVERGLYARSPRKELNVYLDALVKIPCVRKGVGGRLLHAVEFRPGARPLWMVAFDTRGLFRDARLLTRVGYWNDTPLRELSDEELRAIQDEQRRSEAEASPSAANPATGAAHAS